MFYPCSNVEGEGIEAIISTSYNVTYNRERTNATTRDGAKEDSQRIGELLLSESEAQIKTTLLGTEKFTTYFDGL